MNISPSLVVGKVLTKQKRNLEKNEGCFWGIPKKSFYFLSKKRRDSAKISELVFPSSDFIIILRLLVLTSSEKNFINSDFFFKKLPTFSSGTKGTCVSRKGSK